jgi:hypothetical protein
MNGQTPEPPPPTEKSGMRETEHALARVEAATSLPGLLAEAFDAFELIRILARSSEDPVPGLLAAFMTAADAAVDGREAVTIAPSLPAGRSRMATTTLSLDGADPSEVADALTSLGVALCERLAAAAADTKLRGDRAACLEAAGAAQRISQLMARGGDDGHLR